MKQPRSASCLRIDSYSVSNAQDAAALRYWTAARMRSAPGFGQAGLAQAWPGMRLGPVPRPAQVCAPVDVPSGAGSVAAQGHP